MNKTQSLVLVCFVSLLLASCSSITITETHPVLEEPVLVEVVITEAAPIHPTETPDIASNNNSLIPSGFLWGDPQTDIVTLSNKQGNRLEEIKISKYWVSQRGASLIHTSGSVTNNLNSALFFFPSSQSFVTSFDGEKLNYLAFPTSKKRMEMIHYLGTPGSSLMAFSIFDIDSRTVYNHTRPDLTESTDEASEPVSIQSWLYAYSPGVSSVFEVVLTRAEDGNVLRPVAIDNEANEISGIWYTLESEVLMGGTSFFKGYSGLYYLDLNSNQSQEIIAPNEGSILIASPDKTLVASADFSTWDNPLIKVSDSFTGELLKSIDMLQNITGFKNIDLVGFMNNDNIHFSPSNTHIAWSNVIMEDSGISSVVQIASLSGDSIYSYLEADLNSKFNNQDYHTIYTVEWLDDETLIIEALYDGGVDLFSLRYDGSEWQHLGGGCFLGLTYP